MSTVNERLALLREQLRREHLGAFIFPTADPHNSEYTADHWKGREWISGFCGSAGTAVVTLHSAAVWTDSRYFISATQQLQGTEFLLMKIKLDGTPTIAEWLGSQLADERDKEVGIDGMCSTANSVEQLISDLRRQGGITLRTNLDILQRIWTDRPSIPTAPIVPQPLEYTGEDTRSKMTRIRKALRRQHADGMLMTALDDIAWTLNLRGSDVHCTPVFVSFLLITTQSATLFVDEAKLTPDSCTSLATAGIATASYSAVKEALARYPEYNILADPDEVSYTLMQAIRAQEIVKEASPVPALKAVKTEAEQQGFREAMLHDGIAMVKLLHWLLPAVEAGGQTELSVDQKLTSLRAQQPLYRGLSFDTIAAYQAHGAIVHYEATPATDVPLRPEGLLLLDSGAQYVNGTTDITRTIALGPLSEEQKRVYTLVLKGHIQIELCKFPSRASGTQIDILARKDMWREGLNYLHGTGHGVGTYLNVHEGPHQFRMEWKPAPLVAGMTITDEPGIYLPDRCGARTENTLLITPYKETEFGKFLQFESLTLCPIDKAPIVLDMMTPEEIEWLNAYHQRVFDTLSPHLSSEESAWLREACSAI